MSFPDSLPWMIEYRVGNVVMTTLPRRRVEYVSSSGDTNADVVRPTIPYGCDGWRRVGEADWRPIDSLPPEWLPYLERQRGTEMDPRPKRAEVY